MAEELKVVLRRSEHSGFGFSLLGTTGPPHVIYDIVENSPAADCGAVEAGDVILKVNGTDVHRYTTKEVLKCLRLSDDVVTLDLKRDPKLKAHIKEQLANTKSPHYIDIETKSNYDYKRYTTSPSNAHVSGGGGGGSVSGNGGSAETSPAHQRYNKSPTHLPQRHSRTSSGSSAQIHFAGAGDTTASTYTAGGGGVGGGQTPTSSTTSISRPSRIPTALKQPQKQSPVLHSPQHKRPKPSQIPTKASNGNATANSNTPLQHSNSYSGSSQRYTSPTFRQNDQQHNPLHHNLHRERDPEPQSAPPQPAKTPRFEAYMMTGDLILNLSRTPQSSNLLPAHAKKVDSLRDSPNRVAATVRANGALAPRASGESSPTSSSSVDSPTHSVSSANSLQQKNKAQRHQQKPDVADKEQQEQQQRESINNSYNNSHSGGVERQYRKDSITNDTLQHCEELERDNDADHVNALVEHSIAEELKRKQANKQQYRQLQQQRQKTKQQLQKYRQTNQRNYEYYQNEDDDNINDVDEDDMDDDIDDDEEDEVDEGDLENEEDQTHYDITNIETYNSGGLGADEASDRQCLVYNDDDDDEDEDDDNDADNINDEDDDADDDEEYTNNSVAKASAKQRLRALKQKTAGNYKTHATGGCDAVDCARRHPHHAQQQQKHHHHHHHHHHKKTQQYSASSSSSTTMKSDGVGANTSQDETSFSVPTSPISLSTPLLDKETANSVPTSPEPTSLGAVGGGGVAGGQANAGTIGFAGGDASAVVRRQNGHIVRKCDAAGFRTSKSEDHLQQIQREGIAAVIPIDIDEDVNSSLNTLLDTRNDSEDSQSSSVNTTTSVCTTQEIIMKSNKCKVHLTQLSHSNDNNNINSSTSSSSSKNDTNTNTADSEWKIMHVNVSEATEEYENTLLSKTSPRGILSQRDTFVKQRRKVRLSAPRLVKFDAATTTAKENCQQLHVDTKATATGTGTTTATTSKITPAVHKTLATHATTTPFATKASNRDRIVWTYNAPLLPSQIQQLQQQQQQQQQYASSYAQQHTTITHSNSQSHTNSHSHSSSISSSPQHSVGSPASPTSVSSSVMSSSGSKGALGMMLAGGNGSGHGNGNGNGSAQPQHSEQNAGINNGANVAGTMPTIGVLQYSQNGAYAGAGNGNGSGSGNGIGVGNSNHANAAGLSAASNSYGGGDQSVSEAISNISSPDYQDDDNLLSSRDLLGGMIVSDPSDSDSTILVSDTAAQQRQQHQQHMQQQQKQKYQQQQQSEHKLVIQVRGLDSGTNTSSTRSVMSAEQHDDDAATSTLTDDQQQQTTMLAASISGSGLLGSGNLNADTRDGSPPVSDDGSDVESLHSYHYSPKAVDMPSAIRLAKRLYSLDGFKKSDVSRHLSKNNDFSRAVADEYLKYFNFDKKTLDQALREFLQQFSLSGETQERERVLVHFSKRFLDCNPGAFNSQDAVHTLTCAIMLLNTDLHGQNIGRKMSCAEFVDNLSELNDGENFPKDVLKYLYGAIKSQPLEWALDDDASDIQKQRADNNGGNGTGSIGQNPFLDMPESATAIEYKKGYVMRKCCYESNYKKTPFGKRSWKMFYCTLRDLVLYLHKDEHGFRKSQMSDNLHNAIRIHHALATKANDYTKKQHVFRLQTADQAEYLFQTSDSKELQSWIETINFVCSAYSAPPIEGGVGSQKRFQRPLLPSAHTKLVMKDQLEAHEKQLLQLENALAEHKCGPIPSKGLPLQNYKEKECYLQYELRRYKAYVSILSAKLLADTQQLELQQQQLANDEASDTFPSGGNITVNLGGTRLQQQHQQNETNSIMGQQNQHQQQQQQQQNQQQSQTQQSSNRKKEKKK